MDQYFLLFVNLCVSSAVLEISELWYVYTYVTPMYILSYEYVCRFVARLLFSWDDGRRIGWPFLCLLFVACLTD